jgi:hypothetical protein
MTTISPPGADSIVSQPRLEKTYAARRGELTLVMKPEYPRYGPGGDQVGTVEGTRLSFADGMLRLPLTGTIKTAQGREIDAAPVIEWLDAHQLNGNRDEGFFEVAQAAPPVSEEELTAIMLASAAWDEERLQGILSAEQQGWSRPPILKAVQQALSTVQQMKENVAAEVAADDEPKRRKA